MPLEVFTLEDCQILGNLYENSRGLSEASVRGAIEGLKEQILHRFRTHRPYEVAWVDSQPFDNAWDMARYAQITGILPISTQFNEGSIWGPEANLLFRYVHDCDHIATIVAEGKEGCDFSLNGEACAASQFIRRVNKEQRYERLILFSEIVLQAAFFYHKGYFGDQKLVPSYEGLRKLEQAYNI